MIFAEMAAYKPGTGDPGGASFQDVLDGLVELESRVRALENAKPSAQANMAEKDARTTTTLPTLPANDDSLPQCPKCEREEMRHLAYRPTIALPPEIYGKINSAVDGFVSATCPRCGYTLAYRCRDNQ